jgi:hypothetical protein
MKREKGGVGLDCASGKILLNSEIFSTLQAVLVLIINLSQNSLHSCVTDYCRYFVIYLRLSKIISKTAWKRQFDIYSLCQ